MTMYRQPHGRWLCPRVGYPVAAPCRQPGMVASGQAKGFTLTLDFQPGLAINDQHPLIPTLFIPEPGWADLPSRHDALDTQAGDGQ